MNPLSLHLDRFSVRSLQQKYFTRGKTVISLFIGGGGSYFYISFHEGGRELYGFCLICWLLGIKMNLIIHWIILGTQSDARGKNKATCNCRNGPFSHKASSSSSTWGTSPTKGESPLRRGSPGWEVNGLDCSKSSAACKASWRLPLRKSADESLRFPFHSRLLQKYMV